MSVSAVPVTLLDGTSTTFGELAAGRVVLVVNVASRCGLTPQYSGLERLQKLYGDRGFTVVGTPCNQFGGQEPGTAEEIATFCSLTYDVSFPLTAKLDVNGRGRDPLFDELTTVPDQGGHDGDVRWNFEKWLVGPSGDVVARFAPVTDPEDPAVVSAIEALIPGA